MERDGVYEIDSASVFDLRDLPSHVKHVRVGLLHSGLPGTRGIMWTRDERLEKVLNIQTLIVERMDGHMRTRLRWFLYGCLENLKVLTFSCLISEWEIDIIRSYRWANLRELHFTPSTREMGIEYCFSSENFPRLEVLGFQASFIVTNWRELLVKTRERKQVATTTFLVMRYFLPAELAFMIAEEAAFGKGTAATFCFP